MTDITTTENKRLSIDEKVVAIVMFGPGGFPTDGMSPAQFYQVTIDPKAVSPSGQFIRFGQNPGDEIVGWQRCKAMSVVEILGKWEEDSIPPTLLYGSQRTVEMMSAYMIEMDP